MKRVRLQEFPILVKKTAKNNVLKGKVVVLAASACSSARILLNSKSKQHPKRTGE